MKLRLKLAVLLGATAGALLFGGLASAHVPTVVPGSSCDHVGDRGRHDGHDYICQQKRGDRCPIWHSVPQPGASTTWTHAPCPCESTGPTPSHTPTATPTPSHTPSPTASPSGTAVIVTTPSPSTAPSKTGSATPVADTSPAPSLPVTGSPVVGIVSLAGALLALGLLALLAARTRNRRTV